jgi:hypothetical protein
VGLLALIVAAVLAAGAPEGGACVLELRAFEDGSGSLFCAGRQRPVGRIDAETGRVDLWTPGAGAQTGLTTIR